MTRIVFESWLGSFSLNSNTSFFPLKKVIGWIWVSWFHEILKMVIWNSWNYCKLTSFLFIYSLFFVFKFIKFILKMYTLEKTLFSMSIKNACFLFKPVKVFSARVKSPSSQSLKALCDMFINIYVVYHFLLPICPPTVITYNNPTQNISSL